MLEEWSVRTYEGKKVTFGFVIDPGEDFPVRIPAQKWFKFLNDDYSAVLTDNIHGVSLIFYNNLKNTKLKVLPYLSFPHCFLSLIPILPHFYFIFCSTLFRSLAITSYNFPSAVILVENWKCFAIECEIPIC